MALDRAKIGAGPGCFANHALWDAIAGGAALTLLGRARGGAPG